MNALPGNGPKHTPTRCRPVGPGTLIWAIRLIGVVSVLATPGCFRAARAATPGPRPSASEDQREREWATPDEVVSMLDDSLSLSEEQKARIRPIVAARQQELRAIAGDPSAGRLQRARRARSVLEESDRSIEAILTAEQQEKYRKVQDQIRGQAKERLQQRGSAGG